MLQIASKVCTMLCNFIATHFLAKENGALIFFWVSASKVSDNNVTFEHKNGQRHVVFLCVERTRPTLCERTKCQFRAKQLTKTRRLVTLWNSETNALQESIHVRGRSLPALFSPATSIQFARNGCRIHMVCLHIPSHTLHTMLFSSIQKQVFNLPGGIVLQSLRPKLFPPVCRMRCFAACRWKLNSIQNLRCTSSTCLLTSCRSLIPAMHSRFRCPLIGL